MAPADRQDAIASIQQAVSLLVRNVRQPTLGDFVGRRVGVSLGGPHAGILPYINRAQPVRVSELAQMLQVETPTVSRQLKTLEERGLIARDLDPADGRVSLISLTPRGQTTFDALFGAWLATVDEIVGDWGDAEVAAFGGQLYRFAEAVAGFVEAVARDERAGGRLSSRFMTCSSTTPGTPPSKPKWQSR